MPASPYQQEPLPDRARQPWALALTVLLLSLCATLVAWALARQSQRQRDQARLERFVVRTELNFQDRLGRYEDISRGAEGFFSGDPRNQERAQWHDYVARLDLPGRHPGLTSLAFIRRVRNGDLQAFFSANPHLHRRYLLAASDPLHLPFPDRPGDHLIIQLCEPGDRAALALGLDVASNPSQRAAAEGAEETGQPLLSGLIQFTRPEGRFDAVTLFVPVFAGIPTDAPGRRQALKGWISAGILINELMGDILRGEDQGIALEVVDTQAAGGAQVLYVNPSWPPGAPPNLVKRVVLAGREVELRYGIRQAFYQTEGRNLGWVLLLGGLVLSFSLAGLVWSLAGTRRRAIHLAQDMNASLFEALQRNRSHLASTPLAVIETDAAFRVREWNPTAERVFGYTREDVLGQDPRLLVPQEYQAEVADQRQALLRSEAGSRFTTESLTRTGQRILCDWYASALRSEDGRFIGTILLAEDVTDRRRAESALRQAQKLESLGVLAGGIAHDFNNLLTAILGNTELALERVRENPPLRAALQRIEATTQRGADLARQLLAYAGKAHFAVRPLDLNALIREMSELLSVSISKKVTLRTDLQPDLPAVEADSAQFQQVVMNLVTNASEAIGEQAGTVTLRTRGVTYAKADLVTAFPGQVLDPGRYVRLEVQDDGCGMDAETIGRIFDPFFTTKFTGRGLGLSAMLGIVRGHRAGLRVESASNKGTTFILLFPASDAAQEVVKPPPVSVPSATGTVLVVDDEGISRELARGALEGAGYQVLEARDGLEAVQIVSRERDKIQLVLLDMTMPRMGGAEAFRRIRQLSPTCPVLLTSGYTQKESLESLVDLPPDGFLQKPFRIRELVAKVREVLRDPAPKNTTK